MIFSEDKINEYMDLALAEAKKAESRREVPIGCIIVDNQTGEVIARGSNERE